jgi:site-specific recombinase XerD
MKAQLPNALARALRDFFADHLPRLRGTSPHTVQSYRDTFTLLLRFLSSRQGREVAVLDLENIGAQDVIAFLQYLEDTRKNTPATRNVRLAAIHSFYRYLAGQHPERLEQCQRILGIPFKRARTRAVEYLEYTEIQAVLDAVERRTPDGRRDYALLVTMFNTGARVQEVINLRPCDLQLIKPFQVRLFGKGRKERQCPLWPQTADVLRNFLAERRVDPHSREALFRNHRDERLTRFGVRYLLAKYCHRARVAAPTLANKRLHPHSMRHSTAVHLLQAGVDMTTISHWLGHASVNTTNRYATVDLRIKREAISKASPFTDHAPAATWRTDHTILRWLEALGSDPQPPSSPFSNVESPAKRSLHRGKIPTGLHVTELST